MSRARNLHYETNKQVLHRQPWLADVVEQRFHLVRERRDGTLLGQPPDPVDLAVRNYSKNVMLAVSENESRQLTLIDEALLRIDDDEYGYCLNCENAINPKRLGAIPWARYCLNCQELLEQGLLEEE